jgi:hypothetical protein
MDRKRWLPVEKMLVEPRTDCRMTSMLERQP